MYYVYAIYNSKNSKIYIGQTEDLETRIKLHNNKNFKKSYTARFDGEWILIYSENVADRKSSLIREKQLKSYQGQTIYKKYIPQ